MELRTLNACPACRRQYDVSFLDAGARVRCECGERFAVEFRAAHSPRALRCTSCGANLEADARSCAYCNAQIAMEERGVSAICPSCWARLPSRAGFCMECGLQIAPQALVALPESSACPRCRAALRQRALVELSVVECSSCAGLWFAPDVLDRLCERADEEELAARALSGAPATGVLPMEQKVRYLPCPVCTDLMTRKNFASCSGVILDLCRHHGVWLDHGELEKVLGFVRAGGLDKARRRELDRLKEEQRRVRAQIEAERGLSRSMDLPLGGSREGDLLDVLSWLGDSLGNRGLF